MELHYIKYLPDGRHFLMLYLGEREGRRCGIVNDAISDVERIAIRANSRRLAPLSLEAKLEWIRSHTPHAYRKGYKEIALKNSIVDRTYQLS
jgi:hypothetical protein